MRIVLLTLLILIGILILVSNLKLRESSMLKSLNSMLKYPQFDQDDFDQMKSVFSGIKEHPEILTYDVTGDPSFIVGLEQVLSRSTLETVRDDVAQYIENKKSEKNT